MNREQVMEQIASVTDMRVKGITHAPKTRIAVTPEQVIFHPGGGGRSLQLSDQGTRDLAKFTGMPEKFCGRLSPNTFGVVATELLQRKAQYALIMRGELIEGFGSPKQYHDFQPERVLKTIDRAIPDNEIHRAMLMENYTISLDIVGHTEVALARGDLMRAGANIQFSPIGTTVPSVSSYILRLMCTNGQTTSDILREFQFTGGDDGGNSGNFWTWLNRATRDSYGAVDRIATRYRKLMQEDIPSGQRAQMLTALLNKARINQEASDAIRARALEMPPTNSFELMELLTWGSSHAIQEPKEVLRVRRAADKFAHEKTHARNCPLCHHSNN